jgi:hypothetical protein
MWVPLPLLSKFLLARKIWKKHSSFFDLVVKDEEKSFIKLAPGLKAERNNTKC